MMEAKQNMRIPKCGYFYIATGEKYIKELNISARSLKRVDKTAHITLITDKAIKNDIFDNVKICSTNFTSRTESLAYKVKHIYSESPYDKTFFIDTDTYFYDNCDMLFKLLNYFDILMTMSPADINYAHIDGKPLTGCAPYNSGVMVFRKNSKNEMLFKKWDQIYEEKLRSGSLGAENDQTSFMEALLTSEAKVYVLPNIFNARIPYYLTLNGLVKIVHGRWAGDYEKLRRKINKSSSHRGWDPTRRRCTFEGKYFTFLKKIKKIPKKCMRSLRKRSHAV